MNDKHYNKQLFEYKENKILDVYVIEDYKIIIDKDYEIIDYEIVDKNLVYSNKQKKYKFSKYLYWNKKIL
jgi:hypothetical protein